MLNFNHTVFDAFSSWENYSTIAYDFEVKRKDLRQYSFFQGEEVEDIIDFSKKQSIKEAIETE